MKILIRDVALIMFVASILAGCGSTNGDTSGTVMQQPLIPIECIAVIPAATSVDQDNTIKYDKANSLEKGAQFATSVLRKELDGHQKVRMLSEDQVDTLIPEISGGATGTIAMLGEKLNCDAVLITTINKFSQREGTEYASDSPASVNFKMELRHAQSGKVLWVADYRETQKSLFADIFSMDKVQKRGLKWVSAEDLLGQAIEERLADCPYLK